MSDEKVNRILTTMTISFITFSVAVMLYGIIFYG